MHWWLRRICWCPFRRPTSPSRAPTICSKPTAGFARAPTRTSRCSVWSSPFSINARPSRATPTSRFAPRSAALSSRRALAKTCAWKKARPTKKRSSATRPNLPAPKNTRSLPRRYYNVSKRIGLPVTLKMRHDAHYVETLTSFSGASIGRMIPIDKIRPNPDQPRKHIGDVSELAASIREKGVLEPLLVRYMPHEDTYYIISGERRYHASHAAGLQELPCIEKIADDAETLELALIENLQRKDLTAFEEADGLQRLAEHFDYTHDDIAKKIGRARSSVTETMSDRLIPEDIRKVCVEKGIVTKSLLLQVARQPTEKKMTEMVHRIAQGGLTRDEARRTRQEETGSAPRPQPFLFDYRAEDDSFHVRVQFRKSQVSREELASVLRKILREIESGTISSSAA